MKLKEEKVTGKQYNHKNHKILLNKKIADEHQHKIKHKKQNVEKSKINKN